MGKKSQNTEFNMKFLLSMEKIFSHKTNAMFTGIKMI